MRGGLFDREYHANLIEALSAAGAKAVAFDILFVEPHANDGLDRKSVV